MHSLESSFLGGIQETFKAQVKKEVKPFGSKVKENSSLCMYTAVKSGNIMQDRNALIST